MEQPIIIAASFVRWAVKIADTNSIENNTLAYSRSKTSTQ